MFVKLLLLLALLGVFFGNVFAKQIDKVRDSTIIYKLKKDATVSQLKRFNALVNKSNIVSKREMKGLKVNIVKLKNIKGIEKEFSKKLMDTGAVKFAEPDMSIAPDTIPNDLYYNDQWHHSKINSPIAWDNTQGSDLVKICVLDTGVDTDHPDLVGNLLLPGYNSYLNLDGNVEDIYGHGTGTAGVIGAVGNNGIGVSGVTWNIKIVPVQINQGAISSSAYISDMAVGIQWCANQSVKVANLSYGGAQYATINEAAQYLRDRGGLLFMSAGNNGTNNSIDEYPDYSSFVVVGSTNSDDIKSDFSEYGPFVDVVAPGESIATTYLDGKYVYYSGTSFSSPMTAGVAALIYSINNDFTPLEVENYIFNTAVDLGELGDDNLYGYGRIDSGFALDNAVNYLSPNITPEAIARSNIQSGTAPLNISFDGSESKDIDGSITSYLWTFGDGNQASGVTTEHIFSHSGDFNTTLSVTDNRAAQATSIPIKITVSPDLNKIDVPSNLVAVVDENLNTVTLNWVHNLVNTSKFEVYRAKKTRGKYIYGDYIGTSQTNIYIDENVDIGDYKYKVKAVGVSEGLYSDDSEEVLIKVTTILDVPEPNPGILDIPVLNSSISGNTITLSWTHSCPDTENCIYYLERASKVIDRKKFVELYIGSIKSFEITENSGTYYYRVYVKTATEQSEYSNVITFRLR